MRTNGRIHFTTNNINTLTIPVRSHFQVFLTRIKREMARVRRLAMVIRLMTHIFSLKDPDWAPRM